jgi:hypothetical protein
MSLEPQEYWIYAHDGEPDPDGLHQGPPDAAFNINPLCSNLRFQRNGSSVETPLSGTVELTIDPSCDGPTCNVTLAKINLTGPDFAIGEHNISNLNIKNLGYARGQWNSPNILIFPNLSITISAIFRLDGENGVLTMANDAEAMRGTLNRDYTGLGLSGEFRSSEGSLHLTLCGYPTGRPPVAIFTPGGQVECNSLGGSTVTFSSVASYDPDHDIVARAWRVNGVLMDTHAIDFRTWLPLGRHEVELTVYDSRGAQNSATKTIDIVDSTPPRFDVLMFPECLFPPNHKMALYSFSENISVNIVDVCSSSNTTRIVDIVDSQQAVESGMGNTSNDSKHGEQAMCLRAERAGTSSNPREYVVVFEVRDASGNTTRRNVAVPVPHDASTGSKCLSSRLEFVSDDDNRCVK